MKLSANPESRHFWLRDGRAPVDCYIDGVQVFNVYEADDDEDYAVVYIVENDRIVHDPRTGKPALKWIHGSVEFKQHK